MLHVVKELSRRIFIVRISVIIIKKLLYVISFPIYRVRIIVFFECIFKKMASRYGDWSIVFSLKLKITLKVLKSNHCCGLAMWKIWESVDLCVH